MKKGTLIAVGAFAILLVAYLATRETQVSVGIKKLEVPELDKTKIHEIDLSGAKTVVFKRDGETWTVEDPTKPGAHAAEDGQVTSLVDAFVETKYQELVTDRTEKYAELEVDDAHGIKVKVIAEGAAKPVELVFGKAARGGSYVRQVGRPEVFLAQGRFATMARRDANSWRKHGILTIKAEDVATVTVKPRDGSGYTIERGPDDTWALAVVPAGFRFDAKAGQQVAQQLASLTAQDFVDGTPNDEALGLAGPHDIIEAKLKDGKAVVLHVGQAPPGTAADGGVTPPAANAPLAARIEGNPQIYLIAPYVRASLAKPLDGMRDLNLLTFDPAKVKRLEIHGAKPVTVQKEGAAWKVVEPKQLPAGAEFDASQVPAQLTRIKNLRAARWLDPAVADAQASLGKVDTVVVTLEDGSKQTLRFGKDLPSTGGAKQVYVKGAADPAIYAINEYEKTRFDSGVDVFKKPPPPPNFAGGGMGGGIKGLENLPPDVRKQLEAQLRQRGQMPGAPPMGRR
jgi:hypothetical protein